MMLWYQKEFLHTGVAPRDNPERGPLVLDSHRDFHSHLQWGEGRGLWQKEKASEMPWALILQWSARKPLRTQGSQSWCSVTPAVRLRVLKCLFDNEREPVS